MWPRMSHCDHLPGAPHVLGPSSIKCFFGGCLHCFPQVRLQQERCTWGYRAIIVWFSIWPRQNHHWETHCNLASLPLAATKPRNLIPWTPAWWWAVMESIWSCEDHRWRVHCSTASCTATASCSYQTVQPVSLEIGMGNSLVSFPAPSV